MQTDIAAAPAAMIANPAPSVMLDEQPLTLIFISLFKSEFEDDVVAVVVVSELSAVVIVVVTAGVVGAAVVTDVVVAGFSSIAIASVFVSPQAQE